MNSPMQCSSARTINEAVSPGTRLCLRHISIWDPNKTTPKGEENDNNDEDAWFPGPYEDSSWENIKAFGNSLDRFIAGSEGFDRLVYLTTKVSTVLGGRKLTGTMLNLPVGAGVPGATMLPMYTPALDIIINNRNFGPYRHDPQFQ